LIVLCFLLNINNNGSHKLGRVKINYTCSLWKKGSVFSRLFPIIMDTCHQFFAKILLVVCFQNLFSVCWLHEVLKIRLWLQFQYLEIHFHPLKRVLAPKHLLDDFSNLGNIYQFNLLLIISGDYLVCEWEFFIYFVEHHCYFWEHWNFLNFSSLCVDKVVIYV